MAQPLPLASFGESLSSFLSSAGEFFANLAAINWLTLFVALALFGIYLTVRARAYYNVIRAAYPDEPIEFKRVWGAYLAGFGFNNAVPARGGDIVRLFLTKTSVKDSSYPAVASSFAVEAIFDIAIGIPILIFAFTQGVFPKPPDFSDLHAFDLSFFAGNIQLTLFITTVLAIAVYVGFALLATRVKLFWSRIRQGLTILGDHRRYFREVFAVQFGAWLVRCASIWFFLEAFHVGGSVRNVLLVLGVYSVASLVPLTPGGAGVQQALLVTVFAGAAASSTVAAYSVGQQLAISTFCFATGFAALALIFGFRSFKEVIAHGRAHRRAEVAARRAG